MRAETTAGAMGFVDILIGAMAAVVLLYMAQAARPPVKPGFGVGGPVLRVEVDAAETGSPLPDLAVRFRLTQFQTAVAAVSLKEVGERRLFSGDTDGGAAHTVRFGEKATFEDGELVLVYLHDLRGRPREKPLVVRAVLTAGGKETTWRLALTADEPVKVKALSTLSGQRAGDPGEWSQP